MFKNKNMTYFHIFHIDNAPKTHSLDRKKFADKIK